MYLNLCLMKLFLPRDNFFFFNKISRYFEKIGELYIDKNFINHKTCIIVTIENLTVEFHILYTLNKYVKFCVNWTLFSI